MFKILIADDHAVVRRGLRQIINDEPDFEVVGEAQNGQEVLEMIGQNGCDVVVLDITMPDKNGLVVLQEAKMTHPQLPVQILSMHPEDQFALRALKLRDGHEIGRFRDYPRPLAHFLPDDIAEDAAFALLKMPLRAVQLFLHLARQDWQRDQLRVRVLERRARGRTVILENHDVPQPDVPFQIKHPLAPGPEHLLDLRLRKRRERLRVARRFDNHFVRADAVHPIEEPLAFAIEIALDAQRRKFVGHDTDIPARAVAPGENLRRRLVFVSLAERAMLVAFGGDCFDLKIAGALLPLGRDDDPAARDRIFSQVGHELSLRTFHIEGAPHQFYCLRTLLLDDGYDVETTGDAGQPLEKQI